MIRKGPISPSSSSHYVVPKQKHPTTTTTTTTSQTQSLQYFNKSSSYVSDSDSSTMVTGETDDDEEEEEENVFTRHRDYDDRVIRDGCEDSYNDDDDSSGSSSRSSYYDGTETEDDDSLLQTTDDGTMTGTDEYATTEDDTTTDGGNRTTDDEDDGIEPMDEAKVTQTFWNEVEERYSDNDDNPNDDGNGTISSRLCVPLPGQHSIGRRKTPQPQLVPMALPSPSLAELARAQSQLNVNDDEDEAVRTTVSSQGYYAYSNNNNNVSMSFPSSPNYRGGSSKSLYSTDSLTYSVDDTATTTRGGSSVASHAHNSEQLAAVLDTISLLANGSSSMSGTNKTNRLSKPQSRGIATNTTNNGTLSSSLSGSHNNPELWWAQGSSSFRREATTVRYDEYDYSEDQEEYVDDDDEEEEGLELVAEEEEEEGIDLIWNGSGGVEIIERSPPRTGVVVRPRRTSPPSSKRRKPTCASTRNSSNGNSNEWQQPPPSFPLPPSETTTTSTRFGKGQSGPERTEEALINDRDPSPPRRVVSFASESTAPTHNCSSSSHHNYRPRRSWVDPGLPPLPPPPPPSLRRHHQYHKDTYSDDEYDDDYDDDNDNDDDDRYTVGTIAAARRIQRWYRDSIDARLDRAAALIVQTHWRRIRSQRRLVESLVSVIVAQSVARKFVVRTRYRLWKSAVVRIQSGLRVWTARRHYLRQRRAATIVRLWWKRCCRHRREDLSSCLLLSSDTTSKDSVVPVPLSPSDKEPSWKFKLKSRRHRKGPITDIATTAITTTTTTPIMEKEEDEDATVDNHGQDDTTLSTPPPPESPYRHRSHWNWTTAKRVGSSMSTELVNHKPQPQPQPQPLVQSQSQSQPLQSHLLLGDLPSMSESSLVNDPEPSSPKKEAATLTNKDQAKENTTRHIENSEEVRPKTEAVPLPSSPLRFWHRPRMSPEHLIVVDDDGILEPTPRSLSSSSPSVSDSVGVNNNVDQSKVRFVPKSSEPDEDEGLRKAKEESPNCQPQSPPFIPQDDEGNHDHCIETGINVDVDADANTMIIPKTKVHFSTEEICAVVPKSFETVWDEASSVAMSYFEPTPQWEDSLVTVPVALPSSLSQQLSVLSDEISSLSLTQQHSELSLSVQSQPQPHHGVTPTTSTLTVGPAGSSSLWDDTAMTLLRTGLSRPREESTRATLEGFQPSSFHDTDLVLFGGETPTNTADLVVAPPTAMTDVHDKGGKSPNHRMGLGLLGSPFATRKQRLASKKAFMVTTKDEDNDIQTNNNNSNNSKTKTPKGVDDLMRTKWDDLHPSTDDDDDDYNEQGNESNSNHRLGTATVSLLSAFRRPKNLFRPKHGNVYRNENTSQNSPSGKTKKKPKTRSVSMPSRSSHSSRQKGKRGSSASGRTKRQTRGASRDIQPHQSKSKHHQHHHRNDDLSSMDVGVGNSSEEDNERQNVSAPNLSTVRETHHSLCVDVEDNDDHHKNNGNVDVDNQEQPVISSAEASTMMTTHKKKIGKKKKEKRTKSTKNDRLDHLIVGTLKTTDVKTNKQKKNTKKRNLFSRLKKGLPKSSSSRRVHLGSEDDNNNEEEDGSVNDQDHLLLSYARLHDDDDNDNEHVHEYEYECRSPTNEPESLPLSGSVKAERPKPAHHVEVDEYGTPNHRTFAVFTTATTNWVAEDQDREGSGVNVGVGVEGIVCNHKDDNNNHHDLDVMCSQSGSSSDEEAPEPKTAGTPTHRPDPGSQHEHEHEHHRDQFDDLDGNDKTIQRDFYENDNNLLKKGSYADQVFESFAVSCSQEELDHAMEEVF